MIASSGELGLAGTGGSLVTSPQTNRLALEPGARELAMGNRGSYSASMKAFRPVITLLVALVVLEGLLFEAGSANSLATIRDGILLGFLFGVPTLLVAGILLLRQHWVVMAAVMYSTIALALDLSTIVQEASQASPRPPILALTLGSSLLNFLLMIFGGRCALSFRPDESPPTPPSQSSVPFFILSGLIRTNPAARSHSAVSLNE